MGKPHDSIGPELADWIRAQPMFVVATAPRDGDLINCSPKGLDTFAILGPLEVAYLDIGGSGIETVAHLKENGRIVFMFCAFESPPKIVRLHGAGNVIEPGSPEFGRLLEHFPEPPVCRAIVRASITRVQDSCGFGVPLMTYAGQRDTLARYVKAKSEDDLRRSVEESNLTSLEGLPGLSSSDLYLPGDR